MNLHRHTGNNRPTDLEIVAWWSETNICPEYRYFIERRQLYFIDRDGVIERSGHMSGTGDLLQGSIRAYEEQRPVIDWTRFHRRPSAREI